MVEEEEQKSVFIVKALGKRWPRSVPVEVVQSVTVAWRKLRSEMTRVTVVDNKQTGRPMETGTIIIIDLLNIVVTLQN